MGIEEYEGVIYLKIGHGGALEKMNEIPTCLCLLQGNGTGYSDRQYWI